MKFKNKPLLILVFLVVVTILVGSLYFSFSGIKEEELSSDVITTQLESMYGGKVGELSLESEVYSTEITRGDAVYFAEVDAFTGDVLSLKQTSNLIVEDAKILTEIEVKNRIANKYTGEINRFNFIRNGKSSIYEVEVTKDKSIVMLVVNAFTGEVLSETVKNEPVEEEPTKNVIITKEQAIDIALGQLKGDVDKVEFESTSEGGFYLIEIEQDNKDADDIEAVFQIHAISGKIMSVTWDK